MADHPADYDLCGCKDASEHARTMGYETANEKYEQMYAVFTKDRDRIVELQGQIFHLSGIVTELEKQRGALLQAHDDHSKELADITARSIVGRIEAWQLIDKMIPYVQRIMDAEQYDIRKEVALLAEIEEKRKPHG